MINKYYTPGIEEFHVGFRYEEYGDFTGECLIRKLDQKWHDQIYDLEFSLPNDILDIYNEGKEITLLRVKYLDKDDIEELGWELITEQIKDYSHWCFFKFNQVELHVQLNNKYFPRKLNINDKHHQIGNLHIDCKNYNELQIIMKQLNIQQDAK